MRDAVVVSRAEASKDANVARRGVGDNQVGRLQMAGKCAQIERAS